MIPPSQGPPRLQPVIEDISAEGDSLADKRRNRRSNFAQIQPMGPQALVLHSNQKNGQRTDINYDQSDDGLGESLRPQRQNSL